jgi:Domain of unknown function (DUF6398)
MSTRTWHAPQSLRFAANGRVRWPAEINKPGCAVLYALGQVNFLSDKSTTPYMAMTELCARFGIAPSTGGNKAKLVRKALGIRQFNHKWTLPSRLADSSLPWLIAVDGLVVDARRLPVAIQEVAVQKGLIPYLNPRPEEDTA